MKAVPIFSKEADRHVPLKLSSTVQKAVAEKIRVKRPVPELFMHVAGKIIEHSVLPDPSYELMHDLHDRLDFSTSPEDASTPKSGNAPTKQGDLDFNHLSNMELRLYILQRGAPPEGNTLPMSWDDVKQVLFEHGEITLDDLRSDEGTASVKALYKRICSGLQAFWACKAEPADKKEWTVLYVEDYDVFDKLPWSKEVKSKYWRRYEDSIVRPTTSITRQHQSNETAEDPPFTEHSLNQASRRHGAISKGSGNVQDSSRPLGYGLGLIDAHITMPHNERHDHELVARPDTLDSDQTLVDIMGHNSSSCAPIMGSQELAAELAELVRPIENFLASPDPPSNGFEGSGKEPSSSASTKKDTYKDIQSSSSVTTVKFAMTTQGDIVHSQELSAFPASTIHLIAPPQSPTPAYHPLTISTSTPSTTTTKPFPETITKTNSKKRKRPSSTASDADLIRIHMDQPNHTPEVKKIIAMNPTSPGTDLPKENHEIERSVEDSGSVGVRTPRARRMGITRIVVRSATDEGVTRTMGRVRRVTGGRRLTLGSPPS